MDDDLRADLDQPLLQARSAIRAKFIGETGRSKNRGFGPSFMLE
jgi:hypothetical protein